MITQEAIKRFEGIPTPFYYYDTELLRRTIAEYVRLIQKYGYCGHYALKANSEPRVVQEMRDAGLGADCVSGGEVRYALEAGFAPDTIVFAGVGKSDSEIEEALRAGIHSFNCESLEELTVIDEIATTIGIRARVAIRINPGVDAHTHRYITTGKKQNKFGIYENGFPQAIAALKSCKSVDFIGLHFHIGSQITDMAVFEELCTRVMEVQAVFEAEGLEVHSINLGGGLGVDYANPTENEMPPLQEYFAVIHNTLKVRDGQKVHFETGRALVAQCGSLISRAMFIKQGQGVRFAILDAGMTDLIRPALYGAKHKVENLSSTATKRARYDVVGPVCESSDSWGKNLSLAVSSRGDLFAIHSAGAYGQVMAMSYNMRSIAPAHYSDELLDVTTK